MTKTNFRLHRLWLTWGSRRLPVCPASWFFRIVLPGRRKCLLGHPQMLFKCRQGLRREGFYVGILSASWLLS